MPKFVVEREIPGASKLSHQELQAISQKSREVLSREALLADQTDLRDLPR